jgi:polysaccharide biosynthesis protein PelF
MRKILLVNWDSYPNIPVGGVYTWARVLVESLTDFDFVILNQLSNSNANADFTLPKNVTKLIQMPLFGTHRYEEYYKDNRRLLPKLLLTSDEIIEKKFLPVFRDFLEGLMSPEFEQKKITSSVFQLHKLLTFLDARKCLEHHLTWEAFLDNIQADPLYREMFLREALLAFQTLQRGLQILSIKLPELDLVHCSLAWMPSLIAIPAKKMWNCPVVLTEHGVAYRELLLYYNAFLHHEPSKIFWQTLARNIVRTVYTEADVVVPVCKSNAVWEGYLGVHPSKIHVIYNGIATDRFKPTKPEENNKRPTIVSVARVNLFKDIVGLIQAISYVRERIPEVQCLLYGSSDDLDYAQKCLNLAGTLGLGDSFQFMGPTSTPETAYNQGDIVVFTSITEGFPFTLVEAMACGKAIVASDVGGVSEALEGCGLLVRSRRPRELATQIIKLLENRDLRLRFGAAAQKRANEKFSLHRMTNEYRALYEELLSPEYAENEAVVVQ